MANGPDNTDNHANREQTRHHQMRPDDGKVEVAHIQQPPFVGHVEFTAFGENHRHQRRQHQMECQHDVIDFPPEAVAIAAVHPRADINRKEQMRERIRDNQAR